MALSIRSVSPLVVALVAAAVVAIGATSWIAASSRARSIEACLADVDAAGAACPGDAGGVRALRVLSVAGLVAMFAGVFVAGGLLVVEERRRRRSPRSRRDVHDGRRLQRARPRFEDAPAAVAKTPKPVASGRHCARCSAALFVGDDACRSCGAAVAIACAICGADIRNARTTCPQCGMGLGVS